MATKKAAKKATRVKRVANVIFIARTNLEWDQRETELLTFEEAQAHVAKMNADNFGGDTKKRPWHLPEVEPLFSLADRNRYSPAANPKELPNCHSNFYWSQTIYKPDPAYRWGVHFYDGGTDVNDSCYRARVRACRPSQS